MNGREVIRKKKGGNGAGEGREAAAILKTAWRLPMGGKCVLQEEQGAKEQTSEEKKARVTILRERYGRGSNESEERTWVGLTEDVIRQRQPKAGCSASRGKKREKKEL